MKGCRNYFNVCFAALLFVLANLLFIKYALVSARQNSLLPKPMSIMFEASRLTKIYAKKHGKERKFSYRATRAASESKLMSFTANAVRELSV
jgi:hypothetical protein